MIEMFKKKGPNHVESCEEITVREPTVLLSVELGTRIANFLANLPLRMNASVERAYLVQELQNLPLVMHTKDKEY